MNTAGLQNTREIIASSFPQVQVLQLVVDVSDQQAVEEMVKKTVDAFGALDYGK